MSKYGNIPQRVDGYRFPSKKEARRYQDLKLLQHAGEIRGLKCHTRWPMVINGTKVCEYEDDFQYEEKAPQIEPKLLPVWQPVVEDSKGALTAAYKIKRKLMLAIYGITIRET